MNLEILARVIGLVKTNGDKVVLADPNSGDGVVVMGLEQYEALCAQLAALTAETVGSAPALPPAFADVAPVVTAPVAAPAAPQKAEKPADLSAEEPKKKGITVKPETMDTTHILADLTQEQLVDKINRDIGTWKTAQERKKAEKPAPSTPVQPAPASEPDNGIEDEERFFLEPIE